MMRNFKHYINGQLIKGEGRKTVITRPADGTGCGEFNAVNTSQAGDALVAADNAFKTWSRLTIKERSTWMAKLSDAIKVKREEIIGVLCDETGKIYDGAEYDVDMLFHCLSFFPQAAALMHGEIIEDGDDEMLNMIIRKPLGVIVGYLAWNFPLLNVAYKIGPALAAGCTVILKPSTSTPLATMLLGEIMNDIDFPAGVINILSGPASKIGPVLSGSKIPALITMIGSTEGGLSVIKESATSIKHFSLELGGNAPVLILKDADIELAASETVGLKFGNTGQICVAPNRVFIHESKKDEFIKLAREKTLALNLGWGSEENVQMGPMINKGDRDNMLVLIEDAVSKGAKVICGGKIPQDKPLDGNWITPCVLSEVTSDMRVYKEEIFGPIMPIISFSDADDIVKMGNDTEYGLAGYVFTEGFKKLYRCNRFETGSR